IQYQISYFDEDIQLSLNPSTYTITQEITLPTPIKEGYQFLGWYDNPSFDGSPITKIFTGSTENKVYHAKFEELLTYQITFNLGDYGFTGKTKTEIITDFATDYRTFFGRTGTTVAALVADFNANSYLPATYNGPKDMLNNATLNIKWSWFFNYFES